MRQYFPATPVAAAVLVPLVERENGLTVLLTQRATHLKNHAGQISFPGGRIEPDDAGPLAAALRETEEEIGLSRSIVTFAGYLPSPPGAHRLLGDAGGRFVQPGFELRLDPREVESDVRSAAALHLRRRPTIARASAAHRDDASVHVYDIPYGEHHIWGATAGMLISLYRTAEAERRWRDPHAPSRDCSRSWRGCAIRSGGCPWDLEQTFATIAPYTIEEAYEVADAIERDDFAALRDELGDLLFQVVFHAQMAQERGCVRFRRRGRARSATRWNGAIRTCSATRRSTARHAQTVAWEEHKRRERERRRARACSPTCRSRCRR